MKSLRILTGHHAGAQVRLTPGVHRIGTDEDADIRLTDWLESDALLEVDDAAVVRIRRADAQAHPAADGAQDDGMDEAVILTDFVPMQFGEMVLCVGPDAAVWPSDVEMLSTLLASPVRQELASVRQKQRQWRKLVIVAGIAALGAVVVGGTLLSTMQLSKAANPHNPAERAQQVAQALSQAHYTGLHAQAIGNAVIVTGIVGTPADDEAVRALLARSAPFRVDRRYDVALFDERSIEDSLGISGVHAKYIGDGRFAITGEVAAKGELESALARVRSDLSPNVRQIEVRATETAHAARGDSQKYSEMVSADDVEYAETPDGVKHIFAFEPATEASGPEAASVPVDASAPLQASAAAPASAARVAGASLPVAPSPASTASTPGAAMSKRGMPGNTQTNAQATNADGTLPDGTLPLPH